MSTEGTVAVSRGGTSSAGSMPDASGYSFVSSAKKRWASALSRYTWLLTPYRPRLALCRSVLSNRDSR